MIVSKPSCYDPDAKLTARRKGGVSDLPALDFEIYYETKVYQDLGTKKRVGPAELVERCRAAWQRAE